MSKKKGLSLEEKRSRMMEIFFETKDVFQLKDMEKIAPKSKGIRAVPSTKPPDLLNNRVNIPSHMWTVFCCYNSKSKKYVSQAHWAENIDESKVKGEKIGVKTLGELQDFLKSNYNKESSLFNGDCLKSLKADASPSPEAEACDAEPDVKKQSWWSTIRNLPAAFWAWLRGFF